MSEPVDQLLHLLNLERIEENIFRGPSRDIGSPTVFGGQVLGQALRAAAYTVPAERQIHSLHAYFILPGDPNAPIVYLVERLRDGRSFTTRRVTAIQHGRPIFNLSASFQIDEMGVEHQDPMPEVPPPEELPSEAELRRQLAEQVPEVLRPFLLHERPIEIRPVEPVHLLFPEKRPPRRHAWIRAAGTLPPNDSALHQSVLAYASDFGFMGTAMLPHGLSFLQPHVQAASLDHAMWFYRPFRADEWLLFAMESPVAARARGLNRGLFFRRDGTLVAAVVQEGLMRIRSD
ncbi:acyl-CoA thioesterase II [Rhodothermus profundi]|uniref:Acyl-CoA thioesterase 2 n=1 Tax=Rhodothermus profundi TaxID=633813 RepID=A0A1M6VI89_9BACT|nr:acyl-CoA thioesterase II [Rhodothermus profundi]SHK81179.1 (3S)-malyl-CoA thioesterase [Rhodothermus profundi]